MVIDEWRKEFSRRVHYKLHERGWGVRKTAKESGLSVMTISKYVNAIVVPHVSEVLKLAKTFDVRPSYFVDFEEEVITDAE